MSALTAGPSTPASAPRGPPRNNKQRNNTNVKYGTPLPILLPHSARYPHAPHSHLQATGPTQRISRILALIAGYTEAPLHPVCEGVLDPLTRSVWVQDAVDRTTLFERGFFGKGTLSRSDPSWWKRRVKVLQGGNTITSEEVTAMRRRERKQFKLDRAQAILNASLAAEALLTQPGSGAESPAIDSPAQDADGLSRIDSRTSLLSQPVSSSGQPLTDADRFALPEGHTRLTPQTFLQRPTRPGVRPAGLPKPSPAKPRGEGIRAEEGLEGGLRRAEELGEEDQEHLQLCMEEAVFLAWGIGCLRVMDKEAGRHLTPSEVLSAALTFHASYNPFPAAPRFLPSASSLRPDNPFLVSYATYHHYRSLGWVVKTGIKFCCDWLLYKRGLVFTHAEFALLVLPQWEDEADEASCPFALQNRQPMSWQWLNTVNRVNTQVKKTLILAYVTIPSSKRVAVADYSDPERLLKKYNVREVTVRRFVPARMRD